MHINSRARTSHSHTTATPRVHGAMGFTDQASSLLLTPPMLQELPERGGTDPRGSPRVEPRESLEGALAL